MAFDSKNIFINIDEEKIENITSWCFQRMWSPNLRAFQCFSLGSFDVEFLLNPKYSFPPNISQVIEHMDLNEKNI